MTLSRRHWILTVGSFAAVVGVSVYMVAEWWGRGSLTLPPRSHLLALGAAIGDIVFRSLKLSWSAKAVGFQLPFRVSLRTGLAGDFGAAITPARSGSEPARFLVLAEAGTRKTLALVVLYAEIFLEALSLATIVVVIALALRNVSAMLGALVGVVAAYAGFVIGVSALAIVLARGKPRVDPPRWARRIGLGAGRWRLVERGLERVRTSVLAVKHVDRRWATAAYLASVAHVATRLLVLPALILPALHTASLPMAPIIVWPLGFLYGVAIVPAPGGGGAVELAFRAALGKVIPAAIFPAALLWWRFYTFYINVIVGAIIAGGVALRAVRKTEEIEEEFEDADDDLPVADDGRAVTREGEI